MQSVPLTRAQRSRRMLIWTGLSLLAAHLALVAVLHGKSRFLDSPRLSQCCRYFQAARNDEQPRTSFLYLGSSRGQDGFDPREFMNYSRDRHGRATEAFNMSMAGCGPLRNGVVLQRLIERNALPDVLFLEVLPMLLFGHGDKNGLLEHLDIAWLYPHEREALSRRGWLAAKDGLPLVKQIETPWFENRPGLLQHVAPSWLDTMTEGVNGPEDRGWYNCGEKPYPSEKWERSVARVASDYTAQLAAFQPNAIGTSALRQIIEEVTRRGTRVVLVFSPEGPRFRSIYGPQAAAAFVAYYGAIAAEYHVPLINAREWFDDESLYLDSHHLQCDGAREYTRRLADEAELLLQPTIYNKR